jgi:hypothetical protein
LRPRRADAPYGFAQLRNLELRGFAKAQGIGGKAVRTEVARQLAARNCTQSCAQLVAQGVLLVTFRPGSRNNWGSDRLIMRGREAEVALLVTQFSWLAFAEPELVA